VYQGPFVELTYYIKGAKRIEVERPSWQSERINAIFYVVQFCSFNVDANKKHIQDYKLLHSICSFDFVFLFNSNDNYIYKE
jgi:hypothetical protein